MPLLTILSNADCENLKNIVKLHAPQSNKNKVGLEAKSTRVNNANV